MSAPAFETVLVANRGEVACRVLRSARDRGYRTVAVYSDADADALHVRLADCAVRVGPALARDSYLSIDALLDAARRTGAEAIHPGYGFLSENPAFAEAVAAAGLVFVGPPADAIRAMGSKRLAKLRMLEAGVPCIPGYSGADQSVATLVREAERVGFPLLVKASAGGGGRGLRRVTDPRTLERQLALAQAEATSAFGDGELILERLVEGARHVEVQVFADLHGAVVHLFERDCSVQRRSQKVVEEAPSPAVTPALRAAMGAAAVAAARAVGYVGAGTVEMLLDPSGSFYFMEMNTRLQVEHPVTEMITGLDLVGLQLDVAAGRPLPFRQEDLRLEGHAIEARLYAEDADHGFLPRTGTIRRLALPEGPGLRVDHGLVEGFHVGADYDPMLAKVIAHGRDREEARRRLARALERMAVHGVVTNQGFLLDVLDHPTFRAGATTTAFVEAELAARPAPTPPAGAWALAAALLARPGGAAPWRSSGAPAATPLRLQASDTERGALVVGAGPELEVRLDGAAHALRVVAADGERFRLDGEERSAIVTRSASGVEITLDGRTWRFAAASAARTEARAGAGLVLAPMAGKVVAVRAAAGAPVAQGEVILVLEAMKMQLELVAPRPGRLEAVHAAAGDQVRTAQVLAEVGEGA